MLILSVGFGLFFIFLFLSSLHFYWAFGGKWGSNAVLPTKNDDVPLFLPSIVPTLIVAFGLLGFGIFVLVVTNIIDYQLDMTIRKGGLWAMITIFIGRAIGEFNYVGFFKKVKHTKFAKNDTKFYSPLCLLMGILLLFLALNVNI